MFPIYHQAVGKYAGLNRGRRGELQSATADYEERLGLSQLQRICEPDSWNDKLVGSSGPREEPRCKTNLQPAGNRTVPDNNLWGAQSILATKLYAYLPTVSKYSARIPPVKLCCGAQYASVRLLVPVCLISLTKHWCEECHHHRRSRSQVLPRKCGKCGMFNYHP